MQPDENPGGIKDSVVTGDVHHHHYQQPEQIQSDPWGGQQPDHKQPEAVMMGNVSAEPSVLGHPGMVPGQVIMVQQPSAAAKVIGIFVTIWGVVMAGVTLLGIAFLSILTNPESELYVQEVGDNPTMLYVIYFASLLGFIMQIVGGSFIIKRKTIGVHITWLSLAFLLLLDIALEVIYTGLAADAAVNLGTAGNIVTTSLCSGFCGLLVAIPLMVGDGGMDDSKLFG
jgi:hypothetical protein